MANSAYGAIGNAGFLYYEYQIAEAITITGQLSNKHVAMTLNNKMNSIMKTESVDYIALADTDSDYIDVDTLVKKFCNGKDVSTIVKFLDKFGEDVCQPQINASIKYIFDYTNSYKLVMNSKREAIASKVLIRAKKNYAMYIHNSEGVSYNPPKLKVTGLEIVRSSTPQWCRVKLKECLKTMFEKDERYLREYFDSLRSEFMLLSPEEVAFPRGVSDIDKWMTDGGLYKKGTPIHVRGSLLYNYHFSKYDYPVIQNGDKIKFIYLKMPNPINENCIAFPTALSLPKELNLGGYIDYNLQFDKTFLEPLKSLTDAAGWHLEDVSSLDEFFM